MIHQAKWITASKLHKDAVPAFQKTFFLEKKVSKAALYITALGVYEAFINEKRVGKFVLAPGWTSYVHRLQYQSYDVTDLLNKENTVTVNVARGWHSSPLAVNKEKIAENMARPKALLAALHIQ